MDQTVKSEATVFTLDSLLNHAESYVDKSVTVRGFVTHTCKHSGRRCFITDESQKSTLKVEAKGEITGFNRELVGSEIEVTGILHENRLTIADIDEMEKEMEDSSDACSSDAANIKKMRDWMKEKGKDYYPVYYIDGEKYNEIK